MAHEAGAVNGTWCFAPRAVLTVFSHCLCPLWVTSGPSQIPHVGVEVEGQTSQGHHALPLPWRWALMEALAAPWALLLEMMSPLASPLVILV